MTAGTAPVVAPPAGADGEGGAGLSERLRGWLTLPGGTSPAAWRLALAVPLVLSTLYAAYNLHKAFLTPFVVQDDARQHVFWMRRFLDPGLFPNDPIADYFQAVAPAGYAWLYRVLASAGLDPLAVSKVLPVALGWIAVVCGFALARRMLNVPAAGFLAGAFFAQGVWISDDLPSGTPRAFGVPLVAAFLYLLSRRALLPTLAVLALQALVYPQALLISAATLALWAVRLESGRPRLARDRRDRQLIVTGLAVAGLSLLPFVLRSSEFGPVLTAAEARLLPEFWPQGRSDFFGFSPWKFWIESQRSGLLPKFFSSAGPFLYLSIPLLSGFLLPRLLRRRARWPLAAAVTPEVGLVARFGAASLLLFAAAHATLFRLHLPSRYSGLGAHVGLPLAAALTLAIALDRGLRAAGPGSEPRRVVRARAGLAAAAVLGVALLVSPLLQRTAGDYVVGKASAVYGFFASQPRDVRIASLSIEANNIPTFSRRSVLVSRETLIPYHTGYFRPARERVLDLLRAEYASDPRVLADFVRRTRSDFLLVESDAFTPTWVRQAWIGQFHPQSDEIVRALQRGSVPALARVMDRCAVLRENNLLVLPAACVAAGGES